MKTKKLLDRQVEKGIISFEQRNEILEWSVNARTFIFNRLKRVHKIFSLFPSTLSKNQLEDNFWDFSNAVYDKGVHNRSKKTLGRALVEFRKQDYEGYNVYVALSDLRNIFEGKIGRPIVNPQELLSFIAKAHKNTYAAPKEVRNLHKSATPILLGHKDFDFREGDWMYHDSYAGSTWAPGSEVVFYKERPVWRMSYQGKNNDNYSEAFYNKEVFPFLKNALLETPDTNPFRGPKFFEHEDLTYRFKMRGDHRYFTGSESITHKGIEVFIQDVMGELIR